MKCCEVKTKVDFWKHTQSIKLGSHYMRNNFEVPVALEKSSICASKELSQLVISQCVFAQTFFIETAKTPLGFKYIIKKILGNIKV